MRKIVETQFLSLLSREKSNPTRRGNPRESRDLVAFDVKIACFHHDNPS